MPISEIARKTSLSRNPMKKWLKAQIRAELKYERRTGSPAEPAQFCAQTNIESLWASKPTCGMIRLCMACLREFALFPVGPTVWRCALARTIHGTAAAGRLEPSHSV